MKRFGQVIRLRPGALESYKKYHAKVWPEVLDTIRRCNLRNYSIYHHDGTLFAYFEYVGRDYEADMARMAEDPGVVGDHESHVEAIGDPGRGRAVVHR